MFTPKVGYNNRSKISSLRQKIKDFSSAPHNRIINIIMSDMDEDYGFEYSDEEQDEEQVDVENQYYNAKGGRSLLFVIERRRY